MGGRGSAGRTQVEDAAVVLHREASASDGHVRGHLAAAWFPFAVLRTGNIEETLPIDPLSTFHRYGVQSVAFGEHGVGGEGKRFHATAMVWMVYPIIGSSVA